MRAIIVPESRIWIFSCSRPGGWGWREYFMRGGHQGGRGFGGHGPGGEEDGGGFGVRRPLRFLAYKLELDEKQVTELAKILDELKTERAQASGG